MLHGYADGHALIASSIDLSPDERRDIDQLSDQSGTVGGTLDYAWYDTGYPTGRWYVYARTWVDPQAERRGTVWTHSLLLSRGDLWRVPVLPSGLFERPSRPLNRAAWSRVLSLDGGGAPPALSESALRSLLSTWFYRDERPLLWGEPKTASAAVAALWERLPSAHRATLTFCTYAIQPRALRGQLMAWMAPAAEAGHAWHRLRDTAARAPRPDATSSTGMQLLVASGEPLAATWAKWASIVDGLPVSKLRLVLRLAELEDREDFSGALARLDCVEALGPAGGPLVEPALESAFSALERAPAVTWSDVRQLVLRAPHRLASADEDKVKAHLYGLVSQKVDPRSDGIESAIEAADRMGLGTALDAAVVERQRLRPADDVIQDLVVGNALLSRLPRILDAHPEGMRVAVGSAQAPLASRELVAAVRSWAFLDLDRASTFLESAPQDMEMVRALIEGPAHGGERAWERVFDHLSPAVLAEAPALIPVHDDVRELALRRSLCRLDSEAIEKLPGRWSELVFEQVFERDPARLANTPGRAARLLRATPTHPNAMRLVDHLIKLQPPSRLVQLLAPLDVRGATWASRWADAVLWDAVGAWLEHGDETALGWAALATERALNGFLPTLLTCDGPALARGMRLVHEAPQLQNATTMSALWSVWSRRGTEASVLAISEWVRLLADLRGHRTMHRDACAAAFARALQGEHPAFGDLAAASFPIVHDALLNYEWRHAFLSWIERLWGRDYDKAKHVRRGVAQEWVRQKWPADVLIRLADGDRILFEELWERALQSGGSQRRTELLQCSLPRGWDLIVRG